MTRDEMIAALEPTVRSLRRLSDCGDVSDWIAADVTLLESILAALQAEAPPPADEHHPLCSIGQYAGDQVMPCDCDGPPAPPEAMPAIEVGDVVVTIANNNAETIARQDHADYWNDGYLRPELMRAERIAAIYRTPLWRRGSR